MEAAPAAGVTSPSRHRRCRWTRRRATQPGNHHSPTPHSTRYVLLTRCPPPSRGPLFLSHGRQAPHFPSAWEKDTMPSVAHLEGRLMRLRVVDHNTKLLKSTVKVQPWGGGTVDAKRATSAKHTASRTSWLHTRKESRDVPVNFPWKLTKEKVVRYQSLELAGWYQTVPYLRPQSQVRRHIVMESYLPANWHHSGA
jgi:hypothetical protein